MIGRSFDSSSTFSGRTKREIDRDIEAFSGLLELAEKLHSRLEKIRMQLSLVLGGAAATILIAAGSMASFSRSLFLGEDYSLFRLIETPINLVLASIILVAYLGSAFLTVYLRLQMRRESRALKEVMGIVHEVLRTSEVSFSPLENTQIRIRLSRLDN
jgi:hypothetical protein